VDATKAGPHARRSAVVAIGVEAFQPRDTRIRADDLPYTFLPRAWVHWDARWYATIARDGYWYTPGQQSPVAFFPAYPAVVGAFHALGANRFVAGVLLTMVFGCAALFLFNRWAALLVDEPRALLATALLSLYPFSFFLFGAMYSDATFLCVTVGAFYALERGRLWAAILLGIVATAARPIGPAVMVGLVARRMELRAAAGARIGAGDLAPALAGLGLGAYMLFLWYRFGDPLAFAHVQAAPGWDNLEGPRSWFKLRFWELVRAAPTDTGTILMGVHAVIAIGALACAIPIWRRLSRGYALYVATAVGMPLVSSKDFMGLGRYAIAAFPAFVMAALLLEPRPAMRRAFMIASALGFFFLALAFAADNQVA